MYLYLWMCQSNPELALAPALVLARSAPGGQKKEEKQKSWKKS